MRRKPTTTRLATAIAVAMGFGALASAASAKGVFAVTPTISPKSPYVDQPVYVKWKADRTLPHGEFYSVAMADEDLGGCAALVTHSIVRKVRKGQTVVVRFSPFQDPVNGGPLWCDAHAFVDVNVATGPKQNPKLKLIGMVSFNFRRQP